MSRLIKKSIAIPDGVTVTVDAGFATAKGAKGELRVAIPASVVVAVEGKEVWVRRSAAEERSKNPLLGTTWALIRNAIQGVHEGYVKVLEIEGVGYRAVLEGNELVLHLGYALPVRMPVLDGVAVAVE